MHAAVPHYAVPMVSTSRLRSGEFQNLIRQTRGTGSFVDCWNGYRPLILMVARQTEQPMLLEIGGGRNPLLSESDVAELHCEYTVNDIDATELALAPIWVKRLHGDIADPNLLNAEQHVGKYNLIFSQMVFEHVEHPEQGYQNIARLLAPGGLVINFVPTLYALPFVINLLLPERLAASILRFLFPRRNPRDVPKFPAFYRWCTTTSGTKKKLDSAGFSQTQIVPFFGHGYYEKIPVIRAVASRLSPIAARHDWRFASTYAYILGER